MYRALALLSLLLFSVNVLSEPSPQGLFSTINERLGYMEDVALFKANNHKAIEDIEREKTVIEKASQSAESAGLERESVVAFFTAQIAAAKAIQYRYRADLLSRPEGKTPRDLNTVIRPALIELGNRINQEMAEFLQQGGKLSDHDWQEFEVALNERYLVEADKKALFDALSQVRLH
ncbi:chorismate mutase [Hahella sp. CCB-MM4]|uniref:chorismate mutase n=1 Tax=Hahella sp. (strain CCB-MM4) TaxID=1926491 RepID=UPI000B9A7369|nr:chorismate mutase [Hahella sp. CCB-MM4]OZG72876.1 chorismate mutase [Hahella sp. CCB-MM4]